jgi:chloramphenicol 3-O-phosphotransferase
MIGLAREQTRHLHAGIAYDLCADTSTASAAELATLILAAAESKR